MGLRILVSVISEQTASSFGLQSPADVEQLPADEFRQICDALQSGLRAEAINLCCNLTGASAAEANIKIFQLEMKLHREQPEKFLADPSKPPKLDVKRICILTFFLCIGVSLVSFMLPKNLIFYWPVIFLVGTANLFIIEICVRRFRVTWPTLTILVSLMIIQAAPFGIGVIYSEMFCWLGAGLLLPWILGLGAGQIITLASRKK